MARKYEDWRDWTARDLVKVGGFLVGLCVVAVGLFFFALGEGREHATWTRTPCTLIRATVRHPRRESTEFAIAVTYRYEFSGETYTSDGFGRPDDLPAEWGALEMTEFFERGIDGRPDHCFVDPDAPSESVFRYNDADSLGRLVTPLSILAGFGLLLCVLGLRRGLRAGWDRSLR